MTFLYEQDDLRPQMALGAAGTIRVVPKIDGITVNAADIVSSTWAVTTPANRPIASGTLSVVSLTQGARTVAAFDVPVPAISDLDEDYLAKVDWATAARSGKEIVTFDVVVSPLPELVSLNDVVRHRSNAAQMFERIGRNQGEPSSSSAQEAAEAGVRSIAILGRQEMMTRLRRRAHDEGKPYPAQILDRRELGRVEVLFTLRALFAALARDPQEGEDEASALYRHYTNQADMAFENMRVAYHTSDDLGVVGVTDFNQTFYLRREQA